MTTDRDYVSRSMERDAAKELFSSVDADKMPGAGSGDAAAHIGFGADTTVEDVVGAVRRGSKAVATAGQAASDKALVAAQPRSDLAQRGVKIKAALRARLGEEVFSSWFASLEFQGFDGEVLKVTVPVKFLRNWIQTHYADVLIACASSELPGIQRVEVILRKPAGMVPRQPNTAIARPAVVDHGPGFAEVSVPAQPARTGAATPAAAPKVLVNGLECSSLDPRYTFDSFVTGPANRMAHAGAVQVAETVFAESRGFNPLFLHSSVGHGKSHLLHAIAWEVRRRTPHAKVLYLTAERFRFTFVEALKAQDAMAFKERFRAIDMLLIDDLEFMTGEKTELEFDHIINILLDSGRQLVVASARPPAQLTRLNDRMRSRLQRGLVTEIGAMDLELRTQILERRVKEKRAADPSFEISRDVLELIAEKLTESGRELEGAVTRLYAQWHMMHTPITLDSTRAMLGDLVNNGEPRRIRIEDILRIVSRHYGVSRTDLLSERRHRSVVLPRQVGMYLAKQLTARSLPEIGRRFGNRDHTTVLHAIRKIQGCVEADVQLKDEIEELKKQLAPESGVVR